MTTNFLGNVRANQLWTILACLLALIGNMFSLPLFFGVDLIFGSIAVMAALAFLGIIPGVITALVGGLYTLVIWGHPYALIIFISEALVVGILYQRFTQNLVLADLLFWLIIGVPLIMFFYHQMLGLPWPRVFGIALKQPINGIINTLIAGNLLIFLKLYAPQRWTGRLPRPSVETILFHLLLGAIVISGTMPLLFESRANREQQELIIAERSQEVASSIAHAGGRHANELAAAVRAQYLRPGEGALLRTHDGVVIARHGAIHSWPPVTGTIEPSVQNLTRWLPSSEMPSMLREQQARYRLETELDDGLTLLIEHGAARVVDLVEQARLRLFEVIALLICLGALVSRLTSQRLTRPLHLLATSERNVTSLASSKTLATIADSPILEYQTLAAALQQAASQVEDSFAKQRQTQAELEQLVKDRTAELELVIDSTGVGIWDWQITSGVTHFNERWADIIGYSLAELEPLSIETWLEHTHPDDLVVSNRLLEQYWSGQHARYECESRMRHKKGHWVWVLDTGRVVEWLSEGKPARMIGTHFDITRQKEAQQELIQAKDTAESATRSKSEFLAVMSHEIRTPMNGVLGMLDLMNKSGLNEDQTRQIDLATSSAQSLLTLINDILDFSKIDAGHLELESAPFDIALLFKDSVAALEYRAKEKQLELQLDLDCNGINLVSGDPHRLRQILTNLIGNAIKFTDAGYVNINSRLETHASGSLLLHTAVKDTGIGIASDKLEQLFRPFTQADSSTARHFGGTGLGLSIVKQLCELFGGSISATSALGVGSCFTFNVVLQAVTANEARAFAAHHSERVSSLPPTDNKEHGGVISNNRLLVVEDHRINQEVVLGMLKGTGLHADIANNGKEALRALNQSRDTPYAAILMDCQMPELDGYEATRRIRAGDTGDIYQQVPIIAMTAAAMAGDRARCLNAGMNDYLSKPVEKAKLITALRHWMTLGPAAPHPGNAEPPPVSNETWDMLRALERMNGSSENLHMLIGIFFEEIPDCIAALRRTIIAEDSEQVAFHAHSIKGMVGNLCADTLHNALGALEAAARQGETARLQPLYQQVELSLIALDKALHRYIARPDNHPGR